jgi:VanZ family protein
MKRYPGALAVCTLLIAYASLYPFVPLRLPSDLALDVFFRPRYVVAFDIAINVVAYMPLGVIAAYRYSAKGAAHPLLRAIAYGAALSITMELLQLYIPNRVSSLHDVLANTAGTALGALAFAEPLHAAATRPLEELRERVFIEGVWGDVGVILLVVWLVAQLNPALPFFGAGNIVIHDGAFLEHGAEGQEAIVWLQALAVGLSICGFGLLVSALMKGAHGALRTTLVLLSLALWLKFAAGAAMLKPHFSAEWVSVERVIGLAAGALAFVPLRRLARPARIYLALVLILAGALFSKIFESYSPLEELLRLFSWPYGQLAGFATLTRYLHELWPFAAIVFLVGLFFHARKMRR